MQQPEQSRESEQTAPSGPVPPDQPTKRARLIATGLVALLGLSGAVLTSAVLAGGTAPPTGDVTDVTSAPVGGSGSPSPSTTDPTSPPVTTLPPEPRPAQGTGAAHAPTPTTGAAPAPSTTLPATPSGTAPSAGADTACGGQPTVTVEGQQWACTFDDEFDGTGLDTGKWVVQQTADGGYHSGQECDEDDPANVSVSDGSLHLTAEQVASFLCPGDPPYFTQYTSGMVSTASGSPRPTASSRSGPRSRARPRKDCRARSGSIRLS